MSDYQFPEESEIEEAMRQAHRALEGIVMPGVYFDREEDLQITDVLSQFPTMVRLAGEAMAARLGPLIGWRAPRREGDWDLIVTCADLDGEVFSSGDITLEIGAVDGPAGGWHGSSLDRASRAYRRECGWDFSPGESGMWLLMLAPVRGAGGGDDWGFTGHLAGFVILYDRDEDGIYESVAHVWTASAWRRRGIAARLLQEAKSRFCYEYIEGPLTEAGRAFVASLDSATGAARRRPAAFTTPETRRGALGLPGQLGRAGQVMT